MFSKIIFSFFTFISFSFFPLFAFAEEEAQKEVNAGLSTIIESLLETQQLELAAMKAESISLAATLKENIPILQKDTKSVQQEFDDILSVAHTSNAIPSEVGIFIEQTRRLIIKLQEEYEPLQESSLLIDQRLVQLTSLRANIKSMTDETSRAIDRQAKELIRTYSLYQTNLKKYLKPAEELIKEMQEENTATTNEMPHLWLDYYLSSISDLYKEGSIHKEYTQLTKITTTLTLRFANNIPQTQQGWLSVLIKFTLFSFIIGCLLLLTKKPSQYLPEAFHSAWTRILHYSAPWIIIGLALHYAAWIDGKVFQTISSLGTLFLCWGQMNLAWILYCIQRKNFVKVSPLWPMFLPLLVGILLFYLDPFPLLMSILWFSMLGFIFVQLYRHKKTSFTLPRYILYGFMVVIGFGMLIIPVGLVRFSILTCMLYTVLAVGLLQAIAFLNVSNLVHEYLPKAGIQAIASNIVLSIAVPVVLLFAILSPSIWIVAYPGGQYIIQNFGNFDFKIGEFSFNTMQILTVFVAYYLTRSIIDIACSFLDTSWSKNYAATSSLTTPIKTTITFGFWGIFCLYVLKILGFSLTSISFIAGGLSVGVGLGLQNVVQNIFSGFSLIFGQNIREGDVIQVGTVFGIVQKVRMRATQVLTYDNSIVFVPNAEFLATSFINWTHNGRMVRRIIPLSVAYDSDLQLVMDTTLAAAKANPKILKHPEPFVVFLNFGASSLDLELRYHIMNIDDGLSIDTQVRLDINKAYKENNIEIPFPQTDIHFYKHDIVEETQN